MTLVIGSNTCRTGHAGYLIRARVIRTSKTDHTYAGHGQDPALIFTRMPVSYRHPVGLINGRHTMDAQTEITNFAAAAWSTIIIDDHPGTDADRDEITRNLAAYGPAINDKD